MLCRVLMRTALLSKAECLLTLTAGSDLHILQPALQAAKLAPTRAIDMGTELYDVAKAKADHAAAMTAGLAAEQRAKAEAKSKAGPKAIDHACQDGGQGADQPGEAAAAGGGGQEGNPSFRRRSIPRPRSPRRRRRPPPRRLRRSSPPRRLKATTRPT